jgi:hypothetical protein
VLSVQKQQIINVKMAYHSDVTVTGHHTSKTERNHLGRRVEGGKGQKSPRIQKSSQRNFTCTTNDLSLREGEKTGLLTFSESTTISVYLWHMLGVLKLEVLFTLAFIILSYSEADLAYSCHRASYRQTGYILLISLPDPRKLSSPPLPSLRLPK